jgi:hypothetical protein
MELVECWFNQLGRIPKALHMSSLPHHEANPHIVLAIHYTSLSLLPMPLSILFFDTGDFDRYECK